MELSLPVAFPRKGEEITATISLAKPLDPRVLHIKQIVGSKEGVNNIVHITDSQRYFREA